jgi:hypothetical protein
MRILYRIDMNAAEKAAFQQWASEEHEWCMLIQDARQRERDREHELRVACLRGSSALRAAIGRGSEDVTAVDIGREGKAA